MDKCEICGKQDATCRHRVTRDDEVWCDACWFKPEYEKEIKCMEEAIIFLRQRIKKAETALEAEQDMGNKCHDEIDRLNKQVEMLKARTYRIAITEKTGYNFMPCEIIDIGHSDNSAMLESNELQEYIEKLIERAEKYERNSCVHRTRLVNGECGQFQELRKRAEKAEKMLDIAISGLSGNCMRCKLDRTCGCYTNKKEEIFFMYDEKKCKEAIRAELAQMTKGKNESKM